MSLREMSEGSLSQLIWNITSNTQNCSYSINTRSQWQKLMRSHLSASISICIWRHTWSHITIVLRWKEKEDHEDTLHISRGKENLVWDGEVTGLFLDELLLRSGVGNAVGGKLKVGGWEPSQGISSSPALVPRPTVGLPASTEPNL